ncbi:MAG: SpoIIIAH-like family protein [Clostridia bacterium]|nr:SpoIIIAH-like family protein [Clostridia bacterium]
MLGKKSRIFVLVGMVALLVITGALNIYLNKNAQDAQTGADAQFSSSDFFVTYRTDRNETRNQELLNLDAIITGGVASDETVNDAQQQKLMLTSAMETELTLEGLIKAVGFEDAVVIASSENVSVILKTEELTSKQVARVLEIVTDETGKTASSVRIIPVE